MSEDHCRFCGSEFANCLCENHVGAEDDPNDESDEEEEEEEEDLESTSKGKGEPVGCGNVRGQAWYTFNSQSGCKAQFQRGDPSSISKHISTRKNKKYLGLFWWSIPESDSYGPGIKTTDEMRAFINSLRKRKPVLFHLLS